MKYFLLITLFFNLLACLPEQQVRTTELDNNISSQNDDDSTGSSTSDDSTTTPQWLNSGITSDTLSIDVDNKKTIYLIGESINQYLQSSDNFTNTYCLEVRFPQSALQNPKRLRVKVVPSFSNNFVQGQTTRFFAVNLASDLGNNFCEKSSTEIVNGSKTLINYNDSNYDGFVNAQDISVAYKTDDICLGCLNFLNSNEIILYANNNNNTLTTTTDDFLERIDTATIDYTKIDLRIDMNSNSDSGQSSCTDSDCQATGFDCCLQGQCVNNKGFKLAGIQADPTGFAVAESFKTTNPNWYRDYPQFYYACLERPDEDEIPQDPPEPDDPIGDADERLQELISDYQCIEELEANALTVPFHRNPINTGASYTQCNVTDTTNTLYYQEVMKRLYTNCGCVEKTDLTKMVDTCPAYTYEPIYQTDDQGNQTSTIIALNCKSPDVAQTPLPFQDLEVAINSKSAPHRFFDTTGTEINPYESLPSGATGVQEGDTFQYLDDTYIFPRNGDFNMNSIIGQMTIQLDQAHPAYQIKLDFDKQYIISTRSGFFQACPTCAKDSWFNNFSAYPFSNTGVGIQPVGFTTRRDTFVTNTTLGNYEDTIFSRACFLPPTMIPFGHSKEATTQQQRQLRLKTQAAMFVNGYQRDWFGFNKGALIGSFDGVTWFAIGKGRIVKSTSDTLYLAINAPFADLTSPTNHIVAVQEYDFSATAPIYDYDPSLAINSSAQNEAGSCQEWHRCDTDSHCISKLGWEYVCADVTYYKTKWPNFEATGAIEVANQERIGTIIDFLQQGELPPSSGNKRCVYRGAGAPCRTDYENISDEGLRKSLTCAPNFYCAKASTSNAFNTEVARFGRPLDELVESKNHIYGQDANILGRPKHYLGTGNLSSLPADVVTTLEENLAQTDSTGSGNFGLCRPGKLLPDYETATDTKDWEPASQHKSADTKFRTDYTSQIGACNSTLYTDLRYSSCPILDEDGNYIHTQDDFLNDNFLVPDITLPLGQQAVVERYSFAQNACGLESLNSTAVPTITSTGDDLKNFSAFKTIEGSPLSSSSIIIQETIARDACLRKAGSVCHTDLDCSPNRLMASVVDLVSLSHFGNEAEKNYYEEYLVCGQAKNEPSSSDEDFNTYNIHNNRCCRPIGESITMYTEDSPNAVESQGINASKYGSLNPTDPERYSRFSVVDAPINSITKQSSIIRPSANTEDSDSNKVIDNSVNITNQNQWKTIHTAAAKTCCGGTWVREFDDGTNDWSKQRLRLNPANFSCINYRSPLQLSENATSYGLNQSELDKDKVDFCTDATQVMGGCSQRSISGIQDFTTISRPSLNTDTSGDGEMVLSSSHVEMINLWSNNPFTFGFFIPYDGTNIDQIDPDVGYVLPWSQGTQPTDSAVSSKNLITKLPSFVTYENETELKIRLSNPGSLPATSTVQCIPATIVTQPDGGLQDATSSWEAGACADVAGNNCCYVLDPITRILRVAFSEADKVDVNNYDNLDIGVTVNWIAPGTLEWEQKKNPGNTLAATDTSILDHRRSSNPGNALYYLNKLARLEYLGIPQMVYEPTYCNDNYQKLVPGIFKEDAFGQKLQTVIDFLNHNKTFYDSGVNNPWQSDSAPAPYNANSLNQNLVATQELIDHSPVFSDNQFRCCLELGSEIDATDSNSMCCSGFAAEVDGDDSKKICKLPTGTNLTVYFNKFVSGEGLSSTFDTPLTEDDFDAKTGEPLLNSNVLTKLTSFGETHCQTGNIRRGTAFGSYPAAPKSNLPDNLAQNKETTMFSIVDNILDVDTESTEPKSYELFMQGFMWNHHVYCAP